MRKHSATQVFLALTLAMILSGTAAAEVTQAEFVIGGPGSCSSEGFDDPGRLSDGITEGAALYELTLDNVANTLTLVVSNTSPDVPEENVFNPVITDIYLNAPIEVEGAALASQTGSGGAEPMFDFTFDADLMTPPNPNGADGFGAFSIALEKMGGGIEGGIANPDATNIPGPAGSMVIGPATFEFDLEGDLAGVTAQDFVILFSVIPPGNKPVNGVAKFQGGGEDAEFSGFISNATEPCFLIVGRAPGDDLYEMPEPSHHVIETQLENIHQTYGVTMESVPAFPIPKAKLRKSFINGQSPLIPNTLKRPVRYVFQLILWNPGEFPENPEQWSRGMVVTVWPNGDVIARPYGHRNGISMDLETFIGPNGQRYFRLPFVIEGS